MTYFAYNWRYTSLENASPICSSLFTVLKVVPSKQKQPLPILQSIAPTTNNLPKSGYLSSLRELAQHRLSLPITHDSKFPPYRSKRSNPINRFLIFACFTPCALFHHHPSVPHPKSTILTLSYHPTPSNPTHKRIHRHVIQQIHASKIDTLSRLRRPLVRVLEECSAGW